MVNHSAKEAVVSFLNIYSSMMERDWSKVVMPRFISYVFERESRMFSLSSAGEQFKGSSWVKNFPFQRYLTELSRMASALSFHSRALDSRPSSSFIQASWFIAWKTPELSPCITAIGVSSLIRRSLPAVSSNVKSQVSMV